MPIVSILIPAYNREEYIETAIRSALDQTFTDIEVLVINDASTDSTGDIAERIAKEDNRLRVIHHPENKYRSGALNTGIANATGTFISILDSDDIYLPTKLEQQVPFLIEHSDIHGVYGDFEILHIGKIETKPTNAVLSVDTVRDNMLAIKNGEDIQPIPQGYIPSCSSLIRKDVFTTVSFDPTLRNMEDYDMWLQILGAGFILKRLPGSTYIYRRHGSQKSSSSERMLLARDTIQGKLKNGTYLK